MIKLKKNLAPKYLTKDKIKELTEEFKKSSKSVWNHNEIKKSLIESSHGKCAYCESILMEGGSYLEVEHFMDKNRYPNKVIEWDNLLPSCKRCNVSKGSHDVRKEQIVNPYKNNPKDHLYIQSYQFRSKTIIGENTINTLYLNDPEKLVYVRFRAGEIINLNLADLPELLYVYKKTSSQASKNKLIGKLRGVLKECQETATHSAICATILHKHDKYLSIRSELVILNLWDDELEVLHLKSERLVMESR